MEFISLNLRQVILLEKMLSFSEPFTLKELAQSAQISATMKTIRSDFYVIQVFCNENNIYLELERGVVTIVPSSQDSIAALKEKIHLLYNSSQIAYNQLRYLFIILDCLLEKNIPSLDMWSERFNVTRPCIQRDVKLAKSWLEKNNITLQAVPGKGYRLHASESDLRSALVCWVNAYFENTISNMLLNDNPDSVDGKLWTRIFGNLHFRHILNLTTRLCDALNIHLNAKKYIDTVLYIGVMIRRIQSGHTLHAISLHEMRIFENIEEDLMNLIRQDLGEYFKIEISESESVYIFYKVMLHSTPASTEENQISTPTVLHIANEVADFSRKLMNIPFVSIPYFLNNLCTQISDILNKPGNPSKFSTEVQRQLQISYPLENAISNRFQMMVKKELNLDIASENASVIGIHLATETEKLHYSLKKKKRALLVSANAVSASSLLYWQIQNQFYSQLEIVKVVSYQDALSTSLDNIDLIISTIPLSNLDRRNIVISPVLTEENKKRIYAHLNCEDCFDNAEHAASKIELIPFYCEDTMIDGCQLLKHIGNFLVKQGYADKACLQALGNDLEQNHSAIRGETTFAIPALDGKYIKKEAVVIAVMKHAAQFQAFDGSGAVRARVVFFRLLQQHSMRQSVQIYSALSTLYSAKSVSALMKCRSEWEVRQFVDGLLATASPFEHFY